MSKRTLTWTWYCLPYIATTQIGHLEDYSITTLFEIKSFCKWTHKIQGSTMQLKKTLQLCKLTWSLRKQPSNLWMLLVCLHKTWESFVFKKSYDQIIFLQVPWFAQDFTLSKKVSFTGWRLKEQKSPPQLQICHPSTNRHNRLFMLLRL